MEWRKASLADLCDYRNDDNERCASAAQPYSMSIIGHPAGHFCKTHRREMTRIWDDARNHCDVR